MSAYDAGKIEASADLDREPFQRGIQQAIREGEDFAAHRFAAAADLDIRDGEAALDRLKAKADNFARQKFVAKVDFDVSGNVRFDALQRKAKEWDGKVYKAKVTLDAEIAFLKLDDIEARLAALGVGRTVHTVQIRYSEGKMPLPPSSQGSPDRSGGGGGAGGGGGFSLMGAAAVGLLPALLPLLPLAGSLVGLLGVLGATGMLAFKGIAAEAKESTRTGQMFRNGIAQGKQDLSELEATAARHVLAPFSQDVALLNHEMPFLNASVGKYANVLGNTSSQLFEGGIRALHVLDPLLTQVSGWVYRIATGFNHWTQDGGLERWANKAEQLLPQAIDLVTDLVTTFGHVTAAAGPFGMVSARALDMVSEAINALPISVLKTLVTVAAAGYLAFQAYKGLAPVIVTIRGMTAALTAYEAKQLQSVGVTAAAAAANSSAAGGAALLAARYGPLIGVLGVATVAAGGMLFVWDKVADHFRQAPPTLDATVAALHRLAQGSSGVQPELKSLGDLGKGLKSDLENAFAESNWTKLKDFQFGLGGIIHMPFASATASSKQFFKSTDDGLASLVQNGDKAIAQAAFQKIAEQAAEQGVTVDQLLSKLPKYQQALDTLAATASGPLLGLNGVLMASAGGLDLVAKNYGLSTDQAQTNAAVLGINADMIKNSTVRQRDLAQAVSVVTAAENEGTQTTTEYVAAVNAFAQSAGTAADRGALIAATLKAANGDALGYANTMVQAAVANQQLVSGFNAQQRAAVNLKTGVIDYRNAVAGPLLSALQGLQTAAMNSASATYQHELATKGAKRASDDAVRAYYAQTHGALIAEAKQLGLTKDQAKRLADQYFALPKDIKTKIEAVGTDPVVRILDKIGAMLAHLTGQRWVSQFDANTSSAMSKIQQLGYQIAGVAGHHYNVYFDAHTSGTLPGAGGRQVSLSAYGNLFRAYGLGGVDDVSNAHQPAIYSARPGQVRVFAEPETKGEAYVPLANDHRRPRAQSIAAETVRILGGVAYFDSGGFNFVNVQGPKASTSSGSRTSSSSKAKAKAAPKNVPTSYNGRLYGSRQAAEAAKAAVGDSLHKALAGELASLSKLAGATESTVTTAMNKILATVRQTVSTGFGPSRFVSTLQADSRRLEAEVAKRTKITARLAADSKAISGTRTLMADTRSQVASGIVGGFDFGTSGNGYAYGITSTLDQQVADAKKFKALQDRAAKLGLNAKAIDQIVRDGPERAGANLEAIVTAGTANKGYITHLNSQYATLNSVAQGIGQADAQGLYGKQLAAQLATQARDTAAMRAEQRAIHNVLAQANAHLRSILAAIDRQAAEAHRLAIQRAQQKVR